MQFENLLTEGAHGVQIATILPLRFQDYGPRATGVATNGGLRQWSAIIGQIAPTMEFYSPYAGTRAESLP